MTPASIRSQVVIERAAWVRSMLDGLCSPPLGNRAEFDGDFRNPVSIPAPVDSPSSDVCSSWNLSERGRTVAAESSLGRALELAESLPAEERLVLIDLLQRRLADERRDEIAANASETLHAVRSGMAAMGGVTDLRAILEAAK